MNVNNRWFELHFLDIPTLTSADGPGGLLCLCLAEHIPGLELGHLLQTQQKESALLLIPVLPPGHTLSSASWLWPRVICVPANAVPDIRVSRNLLPPKPSFS